MAGPMSVTLTVRHYAPEDAAAWNAFVATSKNGTFLHDRRFMEYHSDRFQDRSLIVEAGGKIAALLPANLKGTELQSHGGLTYGGLITGQSMSASAMCETVSALGEFLRGDGIARLRYKPVPHIFHRYPAEEDLYALFQAGARLVRSDLASAIAVGHAPSFSKSKRQGITRAGKFGLQVSQSDDIAGFWDILTARLHDAHQARPTHSLEELKLLKDRFPENIQLWTAGDSEGLQGGIVTFSCGPVLHAQYMAATDDGRQNGALDLIIGHLAQSGYGGHRWFSFGISTTGDGRELNSGLSRQKEMFGARSVVFEQYEWDVE